MSSEAITRNDLAAILNEALPAPPMSIADLTGNAIKGVERIGVSAGESQSISMPNSYAAVIFGVATSANTNHLLVLVNTSSAGAVTNAKISGPSSITLTNGTNQITINNSSSYALRTLIIKY